MRSFHVVLASVELVRAGRDKRSRVFRALRGGGSTFGIFTTAELDLLPYNWIWGERTTVNKVHVHDAHKVYVDFISKLKTDPKGHTIIIFNY